MNLQRVCIVIVTYNRKELLYRNIKSALSQTYPIDILIYDNHSSDGTEKFLSEKNILNKKNVHYYYADENSGGAGGFCNGMKKAFNRGYDLIWLMDDDGYCYNNETLYNLIKNIPENTEEYILNSTVICNEDRLLTFGFLDIYTYEQLQKKASGNVYWGYINPFNGTLISRKCIEKIGFPKGEFFIYGDEHEYMLRALENNVKVGTVIESIYYHPINRGISYRKIWKYDIPLKKEPVWKTFCDTRNTIYITREYMGIKMLIIKIFVFFMAALLKEEKRMKYIKYTILGIKDGLVGNFSRPIMFNQ